MRSILVAGAAQILHVSRILHGNGTLTHYRGLRDDGMRGHRGRGSTYDPSVPGSPRGPHQLCQRLARPPVDHGSHAEPSELGHGPVKRGRSGLVAPGPR
jgi:hypothetical protein